MSKLPSLGYDKVVSTLRKDGWVIVSRRGDQLRLHKRKNSEVIKMTMPTHRPLKQTTLDHISRISCLSIDNFAD